MLKISIEIDDSGVKIRKVFIPESTETKHEIAEKVCNYILNILEY